VNLYLWEHIERVSSNYHDSGGLVVIARDADDAKAQIVAFNASREYADPEHPEIVVTDEEWNTARVFKLSGEHAPGVVQFPDAGCC
jgi:hypothetical protein